MTSPMMATAELAAVRSPRTETQVLPASTDISVTIALGFATEPWGR